MTGRRRGQLTPIAVAPTLTGLRRGFELARDDFRNLLSSRFPGADEWTWHRACDAVANKGRRRNEDESRDAALAADTGIRAAWDEYIRLLHVFYRARDGERGFLGRVDAPLAAVAD